MTTFDDLKTGFQHLFLNGTGTKTRNGRFFCIKFCFGNN